MCRDVISRTLATLAASAIDLARGMGLNADGTSYGYGAVETQVHRMIWQQLCFLDIRVSESQSPRPRIRKDDFNAQLPLNIDDSELDKPDLPKESSENWTSMTLFNARVECNEKIREIYAARQRTRRGNDSDSVYIKKMLEMIDDFRQYMENKYYPMIDDSISIQHYTRLIIDLHCRRMHAMVLHEYHMSTPRGRLPSTNPYSNFPPSPLLTVTPSVQWAQTVIKSGLETMEIAKEIETSEFLRPWRWYAGALQQHSYATLMLIEVFAFPQSDFAVRAWESLDWIFQVPSCIPQVHKARWVCEAAVGIMKEYRKARKLRCPTLMDERLGIVPNYRRIPGLLKRRKIAAKTATTTQHKGNGISRPGQHQADPQGTVSDNQLATATDTINLDGALSQMRVASDLEARLEHIETTYGVQAMDGVTYENTEKVCTT